MKLAMTELLLETSSPIDAALLAWAGEQENGIVMAFLDRFLCDHMRELLYARAKNIAKNLPDELRSLK